MKNQINKLALISLFTILLPNSLCSMQMSDRTPLIAGALGSLALAYGGHQVYLHAQKEFKDETKKCDEILAQINKNPANKDELTANAIQLAKNAQRKRAFKYTAAGLTTGACAILAEGLLLQALDGKSISPANYVIPITVAATGQIIKNHANVFFNLRLATFIKDVGNFITGLGGALILYHSSPETITKK